MSGEKRGSRDGMSSTGLAVSAVVAHLEREHGQARLLTGDERTRVAIALGVWDKCAVIDIGGGQLATVGPRGGGLLIHDLREQGA